MITGANKIRLLSPLSFMSLFVSNPNGIEPPQSSILLGNKLCVIDQHYKYNWTFLRHKIVLVSIGDKQMPKSNKTSSSFWRHSIGSSVMLWHFIFDIPLWYCQCTIEVQCQCFILTSVQCVTAIAFLWTIGTQWITWIIVKSLTSFDNNFWPG